jgi:hypothetical protein
MANRRLFIIGLFSLVVAVQTFAQTPISQNWTGWAQCELTIQAPGYSHGETHLWTITSAGIQRANMEIYPTTWTVTGAGSLHRVSGPTTVSAQWNGTGTLTNVEIGFTRHLDRITFQRWTGHGPARGAFTGSEIRTTNGSGVSRNVFFDVQQWTFPAGRDTLTSTRITGSNRRPFNGARGPLAPGGAMGTAACRWDFARGVALVPSAVFSRDIDDIDAASVGRFRSVHDPSRLLYCGSRNTDFFVGKAT